MTEYFLHTSKYFYIIKLTQEIFGLSFASTFEMLHFNVHLHHIKKRDEREEDNDVLGEAICYGT